MTIRSTPGGRPWARAGLLLASFFAIGCATSSSATRGSVANQAAGFDPVGVYDLTMSSETMVSRGTMHIRGEPGRYAGIIAIGGVSARIVNVEVGEDHMTVQASTTSSAGGGRALILRLARDEDFFSGNWILGVQRGAIVGTRRSDPASVQALYPPGGPLAIGTSSRPPHSDQDPS